MSLVYFDQPLSEVLSQHTEESSYSVIIVSEISIIPTAAMKEGDQISKYPQITFASQSREIENEGFLFPEEK